MRRNKMIGKKELVQYINQNLGTYRGEVGSKYCVFENRQGKMQFAWIGMDYTKTNLGTPIVGVDNDHLFDTVSEAEQFLTDALNGKVN